MVAETCEVIAVLAADAKKYNIPKYLFTKAFMDTAIKAIEHGYEEEFLKDSKKEL